MAPRPRARTTLSQGLDREVYQVVRKVLDESAQYGIEDTRVSFATIYDEIKRSNSSLNRRPKKLLEDSIERVLEVVRADFNDVEEDIDPSAEQQAEPQVSSNLMNRSIVSSWNVASSKEREQESRKRQANGEPASKRRKAATVDRSPPNVSLADMGGVGHVIKQFKSLLSLPMKRPDLYTSSTVQPPRGILIHGPSGCGKTMIANGVANFLQVNFIPISAPSVVSGMSGESEKALRDLFDEAKRAAPCLMFIDEIDAITPKREGAQREMEKRIVAQLLLCMDDLSLDKTDGKPVIVLAATNRPDSLDPALRRGGRFDKEINMSVPTEPVREKILRTLTRDLALAGDVDFSLLARRTPGFVGADLKDLVDTAGAAAFDRYLDVQESSARSTDVDMDTDKDIIGDPELASWVQVLKQLERPTAVTTTSIATTFADFLTALPRVQPSAMREGFATIPSETFDTIGALKSHIGELQSTTIFPILEPQKFKEFGIAPPSGTLLWGPPGCGKTLLAKAVANSSHANFISIKGPELLNKYVGESERAIRQLFNRARSSVPVIIFFDEFDAVVPRRDGTASEASSRVVNTLLTELDGAGHSRAGIYIIAATNRPDIIDPAMLRPGRLESLLYVALPTEDERVDILHTLCKKLKNFTWTVDHERIARECHRFSGADLGALVRRAGRTALLRCFGDSTTQASTRGTVDGDGVGVGAGAGVSAGVGTDGGNMDYTIKDFELAKTQVRASVSAEEEMRFDVLQKAWGQMV